MQVAAIIFLVLWVLVGPYIYRWEIWQSKSEAIISALLLGFLMTLGFIVFICMLTGIVALVIGFI